MLWMGNITANTKLTLPQLMRLKIPEKIGGHYREFGTLLLDDDTGDLVDIAEKSCHYQSEEIVTRESTYPSDLGQLYSTIESLWCSDIGRSCAIHSQRSNTDLITLCHPLPLSE